MGDKLDISKVGLAGTFGSKFVYDPVPTSADLPAGDPVGCLRWVLADNAWYEKTAPGWEPSQPYMGSVQDEFVAVEGQTTWTLSRTPVNLDCIQASVFGYVQPKANLLGLDGRVLTTVPTKAGTRIAFRYERKD